MKNFAVSARHILIADAERQLQTSNINMSAEEAAFFWFSRFIAIRFMEANGFLESGTRIFTDKNGSFAPYPTEEEYKNRILHLFNELSQGLKDIFTLPDRADELFPQGLTEPDGIIGRMAEAIPEAAWINNIQIVGWLYQYYNSEPKTAAFNNLKKDKKIAAADIPTVTQLFTPDWIARFMVDNTLGYYTGGGEWTIGGADAPATDTFPTLIDPCMGSGHILVYAFDVLMQAYKKRGYTESKSAEMIIKNDLYGLDIDKRAYTLAYFALKMKGRQYDADFLKKDTEPNIAHFGGPESGTGEFAAQFKNADIFGSLLRPLPDKIGGNTDENYLRMQKICAILNKKYDCVVTNPPYMNSSGMSPELAAFIKENYPDYKADLFAAFTVRCTEMAKPGGHIGLLTPYVWMFIQSYDKLREFIYSKTTIKALIQFEYSAFAEATVPVCSFVLKNRRENTSGAYIRLTDFRGGMEIQRRKALAAIHDPDCGYFYRSGPSDFEKLPNRPAAYWLSQNFIKTFEYSRPLGSIAESKQGLATGCNDMFLRQWHEVKKDDIFYGAESTEEAALSGRKWFPYNKGGDFRKWYGNDGFVVNWENDGYEIKNFRNAKGALRSRPQNRQFYFKECFSWSLVSSGKAAFRFKPCGNIFDIAGMSCFADEHLYYLLALCNSVYASEALKVIAPTINYQCGDIANIPVMDADPETVKRAEELAKENIALSAEDWDSFEISRDFKKHPLI